MPQQTGKSELASLASQLREAHSKAKGKEVSTDTGGRLPAGIMGGVAQLDDIRIAKVKEGGKNAGKLQFIAAGIVKEPPEHKGIPVRGMRTSIIVPLYATPDRKTKTVQEHYDTVMNYVSNLAGHEKITDAVSPDNIEKTMKELAASKPHFRFRTWQGNKQDVREIKGKWFLVNVDANDKVVGNPIRGPWSNEQLARAACPYAGREPLTNEVWGSLVNYSDNGKSEEEAVEEDETTATTEGEGSEEEVFEEPTTEGETMEETADLDELLAAVQGDEPGASQAERKLVELAGQVGISKEQVLGAPDWDSVIAMIREGQGAGTEEETTETEEEEAEEEEETTEEETVTPPAKGDTVKYTIQVRVKNKKTGKMTQKDKTLDAEVMTVNAKAQTVTLKNLEDGKTLYKDVPWDKLES